MIFNISSRKKHCSISSYSLFVIFTTLLLFKLFKKDYTCLENKARLYFSITLLLGFSVKEGGN